MKARVVLLMVLASAGAWLVPGCRSYHSPATGVQARYCCETLKSVLDAPIWVVYGAAKLAAAQLHLRPMAAAQDGIAGQITAVDAQRDRVDILLGALPEGRTALRIRIGVFGDRAKSIVLFERIMENLRASQQVAVAPLRWGTEPLDPAAPEDKLQ